VNAIIDGEVLSSLEDVEITGGDLVNMNLQKLEDWWGLTCASKR